MELKQVLKEYQEKIDQALQEKIDGKDCLESNLNQAMQYSLLAGGKRLRPMLILQTYRMFDEEEQKAMPYAVAMEMIHNFSLIHDDLPAIDNDDFRHGKLTNHKKFGESTAILAGDGLLNRAYQVIAEDMVQTKPEEQMQKIRAFEEFSNAVDRMIVGEYVDVEMEEKQISEECLEYIHQNKTGALLKACVRIGAILGKATNEEIQQLTRYAEKIGLAFQIKDDILNEVGDASIVGKPVGNDKEMGKCTYVTIYGLEEAQKRLEEITKQAVEITQEFGTKGEFLAQLARYIKERNK